MPPTGFLLASLTHIRSRCLAPGVMAILQRKSYACRINVVVAHACMHACTLHGTGALLQHSDLTMPCMVLVFLFNREVWSRFQRVPTLLQFRPAGVTVDHMMDGLCLAGAWEGGGRTGCGGRDALPA